jgi:hypothetical protein
MFKVKDWTTLPLGTQDGLSTVKECPHCHRPGLEVNSNGATSYKHATYEDYNPLGQSSTGWDSCPKDRSPVRTGPPDDILD